MTPLLAATPTTFHALTGLDVGIVVAYVLLSVAIGVAMSRRARRSLADFFASGGKLPWYLLGTSMIATSFAADTPLALSGMVVSEGISGNWFWWNGAAIALAGVFFFAPLWQRARLVTDNEFVYLRYSGRSADVLRGFRALYFALVYACIVLGWVNLAMVKIVGALVEPRAVAWAPLDRPLEGLLRATGFVPSDPVLVVAPDPDAAPAAPPAAPATSWRVLVSHEADGRVLVRVLDGERGDRSLLRAHFAPDDPLDVVARSIDAIPGLRARRVSAWASGAEPVARLREATIVVRSDAPPLRLETLGARGDRPGVELATSGTPLLADRDAPDAIAHKVLTVKVLLVCLVLTAAYCALGGLWGVVVTDFFQFFVAMAGSIYLAWVAVGHFGGLDGLAASLRETFGTPRADAMLAMVPFAEQAELAAAIAADPGLVGGEGAFRLMTWSRWLMFVLVVWWALGFTDGGSYLGQRMIAARSERDAALGYLWYGVGHYAIRMWPWLLVGAAGAVMFPTLAAQRAALPALAAYDPELNYILVMRSFLGPGMLGVVVASFLAAYMSTVSTHVNLAAGYLVNDFYKPFVRPGAGERHYVAISTAATLLVGATGVVVTLYMNSIKSAWFLLASLNAGIGVVYILRWYWWRLNAWSEIACFASVMTATLALTLVSWGATFERGLAGPLHAGGMQLAWYRALDRHEPLARANATLARLLTVSDTSVALVAAPEDDDRAGDAPSASAGASATPSPEDAIARLAAAARYEELTGEPVPPGRVAVLRDVSFSLTTFPYSYLLLVPITIACWMTATFLTRPVERARLHAFYRRVRPGGPGWRVIAAECPDVAAGDSPLTRRSFAAWGMAVGGLYGALFGVGALVVHSTAAALAWGALTVACAVGLWRHFAAQPTAPASAPSNPPPSAPSSPPAQS